MLPMRRIAIFAAALLLLLPGSPAQSQIKLAVTGGANLSTLDFDRPWTWHGRALGMAFGFPVSDNWSIQLAGRRSGKGYWEEFYDCGDWCGVGQMPCGGGDLLSYIEFMVLSDRRIELGDRVRLHLLVGPFGGHQGGQRQTRNFDFGVGGGAQVEVGLYGNWGVQAGTLYTHGFVNTGPTCGGNSGCLNGEPYQKKTRTLTLRGGLSYSIR